MSTDMVLCIAFSSTVMILIVTGVPDLNFDGSTSFGNKFVKGTFDMRADSVICAGGESINK